MTLRAYLTVNNATLEITDGVNFALLEAENWGMPEARYITEAGPLQHGVTFKDFRLQPRTIDLVVDAIAETLEQHFTRRATLIDFLNFDTTPLQFKVEYDTGNTRQLDCYLGGGLNFPSSKMAGFHQVELISLFAPDPTFYDPDRGIVTWVGSSGTAFLVPWVVPSYVGGSTIDLTQTVQYLGTWDEFPEIQITGPITNPVITNETTGDVLDFTGYSVDTGDTWTVDLRYGFKTVQDQNGVNKIDKLTDDSDLTSWHLARKRAAEAYRENSIKVEGSGVSSNTRVHLRYYERYIGI